MTLLIKNPSMRRDAFEASPLSPTRLREIQRYLDADAVLRRWQVGYIIGVELWRPGKPYDCSH